MKYLIGAIVILTLLMTACYFGEFVQLDDLAEGTNVDAHRTVRHRPRGAHGGIYAVRGQPALLSRNRPDSPTDPDSGTCRLLIWQHPSSWNRCGSTGATLDVGTSSVPSKLRSWACAIS